MVGDGFLEERSVSPPSCHVNRFREVSSALLSLYRSRQLRRDRLPRPVLSLK